MTAQRPLAGILVTVLAMVTLATSDAISKYLTDWAPLALIVWVRYFVFLIYGSTAALRYAGVHGLRSSRPGLQLLRGCCLVAANVVIIYGFSKLPLGDVHAVMAVAPLLVTVFAVFFLAERVSLDRWLAIGIGFIGILIIVRPATSVFDPNALYPLLGGALFGVYQVFTRILSRVDAQQTTQFYTGATGFFWFSLFVLFWWDVPSLWVWVLMLVGAVINVFSHLMIIQGLHFAPASTVQPFHYTMFLAAVALGYLVFGDFPDAYTLGGAAIVIASGLYCLIRGSAPATPRDAQVPRA